MGRIIKKGQEFVIEQVNPKFKVYNHPFLLAMVVATMSILIIHPVYKSMMICEKGSFSGKADDVVTMAQTKHCIFAFSIMVNEDNQFTYGRCDFERESFNACEKDLEEDGYLEKTGIPCLGQRADGSAKDLHEDGSEKLAMVVTYQDCPNPYTSFGAALGYYGFIELGVTVILVFVMTQCGCLKAGDAGYAKKHMAEWVTDLVSQHSTAAEMEQM